MAFSLATYWKYGREYCGIEHGSTATGENHITGLIAILKKGEYEIEKKFEASTPSELSAIIKKNQHCSLTVNNHQVLIKSTTANGLDTKIVAAAFPNIDLNDFYFQVMRLPDQRWVALCRKQHIHEIIKLYENQKISVVGFSLGFLSLSNLLPHMNKETVFSSGYKFIILDNQIIAIEKIKETSKEEEYKIGDTVVNSNHLIALSGSLNYETDSGPGTNIKEKNSELAHLHQQKVFIRKGTVTGLTILFLALLINFLLFSNYFSSLQNLRAQHQVELDQQQNFQKKVALLNEKKKIVKNINDNSSSKTTFYLNRTMATMPNSVQLLGFTYQPLMKPIKEEQPVEFEKGVIILQGESPEEKEFSGWIRRLESTAWVKEVIVSEYGQKKLNNAQFVISINLKPDETIQ